VQLPQKTSNPTFSCISTPKKQNMLLFLNDCATKYHLKNGQEIQTKIGEVVYVPKGCEYTVNCTLALHEKSSSFQINFFLFDEHGNECILSNEPIVFSPRTANIRALFEKEDLISTNANVPPTDQKTVIYSILNTLAQETYTTHTFNVLEAGIQYLHAHYQEDFSIAKLAELCHVSQEYFRRLFKRQTGKTPAEYRNALRLQKAELYLIHSDVSIREISESLGYFTVSHFIKQFRMHFGISPLAYRHRFQ
jgi:AraC-like DNA-binding protein